jgi:hypothetical protein
MEMKTINPEDMDTLAHAEEYAKATGAADSADHVKNLDALLDMLVRKRRYLVQDAINYPIAYMGRGLDVARLQSVIEAVERAAAHEQNLKTAKD